MRKGRSRPDDDAARGGDRTNLVGSGNDPFRCWVCGCEVLPLQNGSFRSHCPDCLWSRHVDGVPGDRASSCGGLMEPVGLDGSAASGWIVVHRCVRCGTLRRNRAALNDPRQPDSWDTLLQVSSGRRSGRIRGES